MKKWIIGGVLAVILAVSAAAVQGGEGDPLVTLGYLTDQFLPKLLGEVDVKLEERDKQLESKLEAMVNTYSNEMERKFKKLTTGSAETTPAPGFSVVTLSAGQKVTLAAGSELLFRSGSALCFAPSSPGLVDLTAGSVLEDRSAPQANHLYLATDADRGLTAAETVVVLVRGGYTIG